MIGHRLRTAGLAGAVSLLPGLALAVPALPAAAPAAALTGGGGCSAGARTLSHYRDRLYPDTGNGGYRSVHTQVDLVYDATRDRFLPGNHVILTGQATQCLTSFSLDFERHSANKTAGPNMSVHSVLVNGHPAHFTFAQPTYPGDPHGPSDPDPRAHEASQYSRVGGPQHNPLPPACTPELLTINPVARNSLNGTQCPASKLVITPSAPIRDGSAFTVAVYYTGRPGVHNDGDGTTEGWFRSNRPAGDGGFVTTEPVGTEDWMPLNDHPSAKPSYDFYDTVNAGKTVLANGILVGKRANPANAQFPHGSVTWHWHSAAPVASYLAEDSIGSYHLTGLTAVNGVKFYQAQAASLRPARQRRNRAIMNEQEDITSFESLFSGTYPFASDGVVVGRPSASFEEEMQTMITFAGGSVDTDTLYHENMHQWWGDNVTEASYNLTFFKEGLATLSEFLYQGRQAADKVGGLHTQRGVRAFNHSLAQQFDHVYQGRQLSWRVAPSNPAPYGLFDYSSTYLRPGIAYVALRQILGAMNFTLALRQIQQRYGGGVITEPELEAGFQQWLPVHGAACHARLRKFFRQWFDTAYPPGGGRHRPQITGPGLAGPGFYGGNCTR